MSEKYTAKIHLIAALILIQASTVIVGAADEQVQLSQKIPPSALLENSVAVFKLCKE